MPVKDLVRAFEARSVLSTEPTSPGSRRQSSGGSPVLPIPSGSPHYVPLSPVPARFPRHPLLTDTPSHPIDGLPLTEVRSPFTNQFTTSTTSFNDSTTLHDNDPLDSKPESSTSSTLSARNVSSKASGSDDVREQDEAFELDKLLPTAYASGTDRKSGPFRSRSPFTTEAKSVSGASTSTAVDIPRATPSSASLGPHQPVPASVVFSREAAPLSLPHLDDYVSTIPAPSFPIVSSQDKSKTPGEGMFPPMDRLEASGRSLEDLEVNAQIPSFWRNRDFIFSALVSGALGVTGSSALAPFYSLHGLFDTIQIFALLLNTIAPHGGKDIADKWRKLILGTIPNVLALNLATSTVVSLILLLVFMVVCGILLYFFYHATSVCCQLGNPEGLQEPGYMKNTWTIVIISFVLTVLYLPISTMAMHVLVWSEDLWVVPNPYVNATTFPPSLPPLGPADEFRDPLDFCWTTTMRRNEINFAPIVVIIALTCVVGLTVWFPIHLRKAIGVVCPKVDKFTELGAPRSQSDMDREYQRLLDRDRNPLAFLYGGFRRGWATYESMTLFAKLTTLLLTAIIDPDNCLFRSLSRTTVPIARQILLLISMLGFFLIQCFLAPFLDPVNNASEWTSRLNFVLTSAVSLAVALNIPGKSFFNGALLYVIYIITYGLSFYFTLINTSIMRRVVKRLARRIDFSIDIFSPRIDLTPSSLHPKRRIWQEAITTLFLTSPECGIPKEQKMNFAQARDSEYPPYLLDFAGSPGERHVENLKILREVGGLSYKQGVALLNGPDSAWFQHVQEKIQTKHIGPDSYWKDPKNVNVPGCTRFFGNAWFIPFPPTVVMRYDDGPIAVIREVTDLQHYIDQNASPDIQRRREIRLALRALDGKVVKWPYEHTEFIGSRRPLWSGTRYRAQKTIFFNSGVFRLKRRGRLLFEDVDLGSGFEVEITYSKDVVVGGSVIGLNDDYDLTKPLARFLTLNEELIPNTISHYEDVLSRYRRQCKRECSWKKNTLTYKFLTAVYDQPREPDGLTESSIEIERDARVKELMAGSEAIFDVTYARLSTVTKSELATWWYIFWDDLWRRNHDTIGAMEKYAKDFNPHYPTSIAYTPLPRAALEAFLTQRGLLNKKPKFFDFFHAGFLNKMYVRMNDILFRGSIDADILHVGEGISEFDMEEVDQMTQAQPSTLGTGGGTDHDDSSIRARPYYRWEGLLTDKVSKNAKHHRSLLAKIGVWFGVTPLWRSGVPSRGLALDVRLVDGRYVLLREHQRLKTVRRTANRSTITISKIA